MKHLVASLALLAAFPFALGASPSQAAVVRGAIASNARTAGPDLPVYEAQYADFIHGFVYVDGHWYPICCIPDPALDDVIAVRLVNGEAIAQFVDSVDQTIVQFSEATGQVKTFASIPGITGVAFDTHTANTYALTSSSLQRFASNGRRVASTDTKVPYESITVMTSRAGASVGAYGQGVVTLLDGTSLATLGTLQLPKDTFPAGAPVRIANAAGKLYLHADGDARLIVIDPAFSPWKLSSIAVRASSPIGLGADANGRLYLSVGGKLAAFTATGKPVQTVLSGQPATADFTIAH